MKFIYFILILIVNVTFGQVCSVSQLPKNLQNGLVAFYPFCGNANDASGNGNNGAVNSAALTTDRFGNANSAYSFNNSFINVNSNPIFDFTDSMTINVWYLNKNNTNTGSTYISKHTRATLNSSFVMYNNENLGGPTVYLTNTANSISYVNNPTFTDITNWHMLTMVFKKPTLKMYIDGILFNSTTSSNSIKSTTNPIIFGGTTDPNSLNSVYANMIGELDEIGFWNRSLTPCEISQLYNETNSGFPSTIPSFNPLQDTSKICGTSTVLDAGVGYNSYLWNTGATTQSINAIRSGFYKVTITNSSGCTASDSTYLSLVYTKIITPPTTICKGSTILLNADGSSRTSMLNDFEGQTYPAIKLFNQTWMASNLNTAHYRNGDIIPQVTDRTAWANLTTGAWCWFNNDSVKYGSIYGRLYNWYAINDPRGLAPLGWHVPSKNEWSTLIDSLGGVKVAGGKLKGSLYWSSPNVIATNSSGFNALPSGYRGMDGNMNADGWLTIFGSSTLDNNNDVFRYILVASNTEVSVAADQKRYGYAIRCVNDLKYQWSTGDSSIRITVSPTQTTKYFVSVSDGITTCTDSVIVTVNDLSSFNPLQDTVRVCGDSTILDAGAGYDSYTWSTGASTQKITVKQSGKITLQVTKGTCTGFDSSIVSIVKAKILTPPTTICKGGSITLNIDSLNLQNSLIAYYPFSGNANDLSNYKNNGIVSGATLTTDRFGNINSAYNFINTNIITAQNQPQYTLAANTSISTSLWFKTTSPATAFSGLLCKMFPDNNISSGFQIGIVPPNNYLIVEIGNSPTSVLTGNQSVIDGKWHNLILVINKSDASATLFLDGKQHIQIINPGLIQNLTCSEPLLFGNERNYKLFNNFYPSYTGALDDIAIYNRALSTSEIQQLYTSSPTASWSKVSWSTGASTNSITVSPTQTTKYFVSVSDGITTCKDSVIVTVSPTDTSLTVLDPPSVCSNSGQVRLQAGIASSYQWKKNGVSISGATNQLYTATSTGFYKVFVTNNNGCVDSSRSVQITLNPQPLVSFTINKNSQCLTSNNFVFTNTSNISTGALTYSWSLGDITNATTTNVTKNYATAGSYVVNLIATSSNGCIDSSKATVTVTNMPTVSITANPSNATICYGASATLTASGTSTYLWNSSETTVAITKSPTTTSTYTVTGTDVNGCTATTSKTITVNALPTVSITPNPSNATLCYGASATLTASGASTYLWNSSETTAAITKSPTTTSTYTVTATDNNGCINTASQIITVNQLPSAIIQTPASNNLCNGTQLTLNGSGGATYKWYLNGNPITGANSNTYNASQGGNYSLQVVSASGCLSSISSAVTLTQLNQPTVNFSYDKNCVNSLISFTNNVNISQSGAVSYAWDFGDGGTSTIANGTHTYNSVGAYTVKLTVTPTACPLLFNSVSKSMNIAAPQSNERYRTVNTIRNFSTPLSARNFGISYLWNPSVGLNNPIINSPVFNYNSTVNYTIAITDNNGCVTTDSILLNVFSDVGVYVPNAFSPNGNGVNDLLRPILVGIKTINNFSIYNRWGQLLYSTQTENAGWDGTFKGLAQPIETYTWAFEGLDYKGNIIKVSGKSTLLR